MTVQSTADKPQAAVEGTVHFSFPLMDGQYSLVGLVRAREVDVSATTDWLLRLFGAMKRISGKEEPVTVFVVDILSPYYLSSQGRRSALRLSPSYRLTRSALTCRQTQDQQDRGRPRAHKSASTPEPLPCRRLPRGPSRAGIFSAESRGTGNVPIRRRVDRPHSRPS